jgi:hypothetical protein
VVRLKILIQINNKRRILADRSLGGNELEAVYPPTVIEDTEKLHKITEQLKSKPISHDRILKKLQEAFNE